MDPVFTGDFDDESLFFQCGDEVLEDLHRTLLAEPISLMLTDADGLVLNRRSGDHSLLRSLDAVHLAPGFSYSEREAGTNGLGLALADRVPTVVRAEEHYSLSLCTYTCAAVPVLDPLTGRLQGSVNLTTWSNSSSDLLLALAQSAASNTSALMLARSRGQVPRAAPRGEVFRVETLRLEPGSGSLADLGHAWNAASHRVDAALGAGRVVAAVGEQGSGRTTVLAQALRRHHPYSRIVAASTPSAPDVEDWLSLWTPELGKAHTSVVVRGVDTLPLWAAERLRDQVVAAEGLPAADRPALCVTAERFEDIPAPLAGLVETVVHVPPLRERTEDVLALARHLARRVRHREIDLSGAAQHALENHTWPGNVSELADVVRQAALHSDVVDVHDLPPDLLCRPTRRLSRIELFERDEIVRVLTSEGATMRDAAGELGMSRATLYRRIAHYGIRVPRTSAGHDG